MMKTSDLVKIIFSIRCSEITCMSKHCRTEMENVAVFPVPDCDLRNRCLVNTLRVWTNSTGNFNTFQPSALSHPPTAKNSTVPTKPCYDQSLICCQAALRTAISGTEQFRVPSSGTFPPYQTSLLTFCHLPHIHFLPSK